MLTYKNTKIGRIGVRVEGDFVVEILLPGDGRDTRARSGKPCAIAAEAFVQIAAFLEGKRTDFDLPLAIKGTPFQQTVWQALCAIEYGETASYAEIAARIGKPKAARAVGMACNANALPLVIPCHRVVASGGKLGGFATGTALKQALLKIEGSLGGLRVDKPPRPPGKAAAKKQTAKPRYIRCTPAILAHLSAADAKLGAAIARVGPLQRRAVPTNIFASLLESIVGQQISGRAAEAIWGRLVELWGDPTPRRVLKASEQAMRACGLSQRKVEYITGAAQAALDGRVDFDGLDQLSDAQVIASLSSLRGIGVWTAQMLLLFALGRPDVVSYLDLGIRRGLSMLHGERAVATEAAFERYRKKYAPYGSVASLYLWQVAGGA